MPVSLNPDGTFAVRPELGSRYLNLSGDVFIVAASWQHGVVFQGGKPCSAFDLITKFDPECPVCLGFHEPEYPHEYTEAFRQHIRQQYNRAATTRDTYEHCNGVLRAAVATACA